MSGKTQSSTPIVQPSTSKHDALQGRVTILPGSISSIEAPSSIEDRKWRKFGSILKRRNETKSTASNSSERQKKSPERDSSSSSSSLGNLRTRRRPRIKTETRRRRISSSTDTETNESEGRRKKMSSVNRPATKKVRFSPLETSWREKLDRKRKREADDDRKKYVEPRNKENYDRTELFCSPEEADGDRSIEATRDAITFDESVRPILEESPFPQPQAGPSGASHKLFDDDDEDRCPVPELEVPSIDHRNAIDDKIPEIRILKTYNGPGRKWIASKKPRVDTSPFSWWSFPSQAEELFDEYLGKDIEERKKKRPATIRKRKLMLEIRSGHQALEDKEKKREQKRKSIKKKGAKGSPLMCRHYKDYFSPYCVSTITYESDYDEAVRTAIREVNESLDEFMRLRAMNQSKPSSNSSNCSATTANPNFESIFDRDQRRDVAKSQIASGAGNTSKLKKRYIREKRSNEQWFDSSSDEDYSGDKNVTRRKPSDHFPSLHESSSAKKKSISPESPSIARKKSPETSSDSEFPVANKKMKRVRMGKLDTSSDSLLDELLTIGVSDEEIFDNNGDPDTSARPENSSRVELEKTSEDPESHNSNVTVRSNVPFFGRYHLRKSYSEN